jgi:iron complex transport system ATP-binding protein
VLASSHDLSLAATFCDRIILVTGGKVIHDGPPSALDDNTLSDAYGTTVCSFRTKAGRFFAYG